jgi:hypothetical protein
MTKMSTVAPMSCRRALSASLVSCLLFLSSGGLEAQVVLAPSTPQVGSSNTVSADPAVPRPHTKPCTVQLFQNLEFADFNVKAFSYTPPPDCPGPWAKVVFTADFTVTAGRQFDRTAKFFLEGQISISARLRNRALRSAHPGMLKAM